MSCLLCGSTATCPATSALPMPWEIRPVTLVLTERIRLCTAGQTTTFTSCISRAAHGFSATCPETPGTCPETSALPMPLETRLGTLVLTERIRLCTAGQTTTSTSCISRAAYGFSATCRETSALPMPWETRLGTPVLTERIRLCTAGQTTTSTSCISRAAHGFSATCPETPGTCRETSALPMPWETRLVTLVLTERIRLCTAEQTTTFTSCISRAAHGVWATCPETPGTCPETSALPMPLETRLGTLVLTERIRLCTAGQTTTSASCISRAEYGFSATCRETSALP